MRFFWIDGKRKVQKIMEQLVASGLLYALYGFMENLEEWLILEWSWFTSTFNGGLATNRTQTTSTWAWPIDPKTVRADPFLHGQTLELLHFLHSFYIFNFSPLDSGWVSDPQGLGSHKASHHPGLKTVFSHHLDLSWKNAIMIDKILTMKGLVVSSPLMTDELL
jgi:hypothetical protein